MKRFWLIALVVMAGGLVAYVVGRRRSAERRELAFREELETLPSLAS
jgi:hypothetical protein